MYPHGQAYKRRHSYLMFQDAQGFLCRGSTEKQIVNCCGKCCKFTVAADLGHNFAVFSYGVNLQTNGSFEIVRRHSLSNCLSRFNVSILKRYCCLQAFHPSTAAQPVHPRF